MKLPEAVAEVTATFPLDTDGHKPNDTHEITSGGERANRRDPEPALWSSPELAVSAWMREAMTFLGEQKPTAIVLVDGPHLDKWHMTVTDAKNTHRITEPRWSVTSTIGLVWLTPAQPK